MSQQCASCHCQSLLSPSRCTPHGDHVQPRPTMFETSKQKDHYPKVHSTHMARSSVFVKDHPKVESVRTLHLYKILTNDIIDHMTSHDLPAHAEASLPSCYSLIAASKFPLSFSSHLCIKANMGRIKAGKKSSRANAAKATAARQKLHSPSPSASDKSEIATLPSTSEDFGISDDESLHSMSDHGNNVLQKQPLSEAQALEFHRLREENNWNSFLWEELPDTEYLEPQAELEDEEDMEIADESALSVFSQFLSARRAEKLKEKETDCKRKRGSYTGKSKQTKLKDRKIGASLKDQGFLGLKEFMQHKQTQKHELGSASEPSTPGVSIPGTPDVTSDESDDPGEPESADGEIISQVL
ncbi:hypothetical protein C8R44DRAFT_753523 [Mycena epipterygia]|nr:hypothetical protein C8R44DRAFT_753523 [Mycena epipterygia]